MEPQDFSLDDIRSTIERTLLVAEHHGMVSETARGWQYSEGSQTISYDPQTEELTFSDAQTGESLHWRNGEILGDPQLDSEQIASFQQLEQWLDSQLVPQNVELEAYFTEESFPDADAAASLMQTTEKLFEHYATIGEPAFRMVEGSPIDYYQVNIGEANYFISRNEDTGQYNLQRNETDLNLNPVQCMTQQDVAAWAAIESWLDESASYKPTASAENMTYWDTHSTQLAEIEPIAERFLNFQEAIGESGIDLDRHLYGTEIGDYQISYLQETGRIEICRGSDNLAQPGNLNQQDVEFFRSVAVWLDEREQGSHLNNSANQSTQQSAQPTHNTNQDADFER